MYTPFIAPELSKSPWPVASQSHSAALAKWQASARLAQRSSEPQLVPFQAWLLYQLRFVFTAEICGAWQLFGGLAAQLSHLSIVLHLSTVETMAVAFSYDRLVKAYLAEKARSREEGSSQNVPGAENEFARVLSNEQQHFRHQALLENPRQPVIPKKESKLPQTPMKTSKDAAKTPKPAWKPKGVARKRSASRGDRERVERRGRSPRKVENPPKRRKENAQNSKGYKKH